MATARPNYRPVSVEEFLAIEWDDSDMKAELDNGVIRLMAGGSTAHARVQRNVLVALDLLLRGSGCSSFGSDMGIRTSNVALRYPDVTVLCGKEDRSTDRWQSHDDPRLIVEVLSPSTREKDHNVKVPEYREIASLDHILLIDPDAGAVRHLSRTGPRGWNDEIVEPGDAIELRHLGVTLTWTDIFDRR